MTPGLFDHGLFVVVTLLLPLWAFRQHRRLVGGIEAGHPGARAGAYRQTIAVEWTLAGLVVVRWLTTGVAGGMLGAGHVGRLAWWIGVAFAFLTCAFLVYQTIAILRSPAKLAELRGEFKALESVIPTNAREGRLFNALSVTAGVCEEILYRGFLLGYLAALSPLWLAVVASSVIFGLGHAYQGMGGVFKTGVVGAAMAGLFVMTGALWAPIVVHAAIDINSGYLGRKALGAPPAPSPPAGGTL